MGTPKFRTMNIRLRLRSDNSFDLEQCSEYNSTITVTDDGDDKVIQINAQIEEMRDMSDYG